MESPENLVKLNSALAAPTDPAAEFESRLRATLRETLISMVSSPSHCIIEAANPSDMLFFADAPNGNRYWMQLSVTKTPKLGYIESPSPDALEWKRRLENLKRVSPRKAGQRKTSTGTRHNHINTNDIIV